MTMSSAVSGCTVASAGFESGRMMRQKMPNLCSPSMRGVGEVHRYRHEELAQEKNEKSGI
jgi:hypothetical protein